ncbi:MAG: hypothetical protein OXO54_05285 [Chloroflexota bacterium]|nr:hypothetical protein [Chloroflexota bacterium]MDE2897713.1 hypothetical protein [Chloroflexota bacterium]MDE2942562.1 hypothetical protein [Chloroflexota bacterium]
MERNHAGMRGGRAALLGVMAMVDVVELATLDENIEAYERQRDEMEAKYRDRWVVFVDREFVEAFDDFQEAAMMAIRRWERGPYLIRLVGEEPRVIPMSLISRSVDARVRCGLTNGRDYLVRIGPRLDTLA